MDRQIKNEILIGNIKIGGRNGIAIQSMTNTDTLNHEATLKQCLELEEAGCDIVRVTVPTKEAALCISYLKRNGLTIPVVADIHFDYMAALYAIEAGANKIRINPGNIGSDEKVREVAVSAKEHHIPIRVGVNSGSLEKHLLEKYGSPTSEALAESALYNAELLEKFGFSDIVLSAKSSSVVKTIETNRLISARSSYPIHIGVTEAGGLESGTVKSAVGIGTLLAEGIGDTVRVSLTSDPVNEIKAAKDILSTLGLLNEKRINIISCPTCGRTRIPLIRILEQLETAIDAEGLRNIPLTVAVMGCAVNGPGEAKEADIGIAGGDREALLFYKGKPDRKIPQEKIVEVLIEEIKKLKLTFHATDL